MKTHPRSSSEEGPLSPGQAGGTPCRSNLEEAKQAYRAANNEARAAVRRDRQQHWKEAAEKLEILFKKGQLHEAYKLVHLRSDDAGKLRQMPESLRRGDGQLVIGDEQNRVLKKQYFDNLLNVRRAVSPDLPQVGSASGQVVDDSPPLLEETLEAVARLKNYNHRAYATYQLRFSSMGGMKLLSGCMK